MQQAMVICTLFEGNLAIRMRYHFYYTEGETDICTRYDARDKKSVPGTNLKRYDRNMS